MAPRSSDKLEEKREESRRIIMEAALRLFCEKGYEATTTRDIIKAAGILNGSLYNRFKSKDEILQSIISATLDDFMKESERAFESERDPVAAMAMPIALELYMASESPRIADLIYQAHKSWEAVGMYVGLYKGWFANAWEERYHSHIDSKSFEVGLVAITGAVGNICGMYANGYDGDYRSLLEAMIKTSSTALGIPVFEAHGTADAVSEVVEKGNIRIMGYPIADLKQYARANILIAHPRIGPTMKKEMSSFDVRAIVTELSVLEGAHMDKIFHWGAGNVLFRLNVSGEGKKELFFKDKKWLYSPDTKPETPVQPTSFASFLRKYIDNARVGKVRQVGFDRVVEMELAKSDGDYLLIFEMFGGGNVLLVKDGKILNCLIHKTWKDRATRPGEDYCPPKSRFDPTDSTEERFREAFASSDSDCVRTLATSVNLGGQYAEEVCRRAGIDKNMPSADADDAVISKLYAAMGEVMSHVLDDPVPTAYIQDGHIEDFAPMELMSREGLESKRYETMSKVIHAYMEEISDAEEEAFVDPEIEKLNRRISKQEETLDEYRMQCDEERKRAEAVYMDYQNASQLIAVLQEQSAKLTWEKLAEGAMKIPFVKSIDPRNHRVTATLAGETVDLDYTKGVDANASDLYQKGKEVGEKAKRAEEALEASRAELAKKQKGIDKAKALAAAKAAPTKQFWFERYKWFITTGGRLVIAGRDAHTNDNIVKKHLKEGDLYAHADVHGAPSVIVKDGAKASGEELRQSCQFALVQSKAWVAALSEGSAFWVYPDQVSKTPNPGEFVPRGAFIIRGKRNYEYHLPMRLAVGEIYYQGARKVMCGPEECFAGCDRMFVIAPGRGKSGRKSSEMAKRFQVPEEEISRILPPGDVEIVREVWPRDEPDTERAPIIRYINLIDRVYIDGNSIVVSWQMQRPIRRSPQR